MAKPKSTPLGATHMAGSMRVVASPVHMRFVTPDSARDTILEAAKRIEEEGGTPEIERLQARLEKVTGCPIAELAQ